MLINLLDSIVNLVRRVRASSSGARRTGNPSRSNRPANLTRKFSLRQAPRNQLEADGLEVLRADLGDAVRPLDNSTHSAVFFLELAEKFEIVQRLYRAIRAGCATAFVCDAAAVREIAARLPANSQQSSKFAKLNSVDLVTCECNSKNVYFCFCFCSFVVRFSFESRFLISGV